MGKKGETHEILTIKQKRLLITHASEGPKKTQDELVKWVSDTFKVKINRTTVSKILKKKDELKEAITDNVKRQSRVRFPKLEEALFEWVIQQ